MPDNALQRLGRKILRLDPFGVPDPHDGPPPESRIAVSVTDVQDRWREGISGGLTPERVAWVLQQADEGDPRLLFELCEEMIEKLPKIRSAYQSRLANITRTKAEIVAAEVEVGDEQRAEEIAEDCKRWLRRSNVKELKKHQADATGKPFAISAIEWDWISENGRPVAIPRFTPISGRKFRWSTTREEILYFANQMQTTGTPLAPYSSVRSIRNVQHDHPTRAGLLRGIAYFYLFAITNYKDWVTYVDKFGTPWRVLYINRSDFDNTSVLNNLIAAMRSLGTNARGVLPSDSKLEIHAQVGDVKVFRETVDHLETAIAQGIMGHELSVQGGTGAGPAFGQNAARDRSQELREEDCELMSEDFRAQVLVPLVGFNHGWDAVEQGFVPSESCDTEPPKDLMGEARRIAMIGTTFPDMPFSKQAMRKEQGIAVPVDYDVDTEDDVMFARQPASPFGGFGAGAEDEDEEEIDEGEEDGDGLVDGDEEEEGQVAAGNRDRALEGRDALRGVAGALEGAGDPRLALIAEAAVRLKPSQRTVDRIAHRGMSRAERELIAMRMPIKRLTAMAVEHRWTAQQLIAELAKLYREFDLRTTERANAEARLVARLYGRTSKMRN